MSTSKPSRRRAAEFLSPLQTRTLRTTQTVNTPRPSSSSRSSSGSCAVRDTSHYVPTKTNHPCSAHSVILDRGWCVDHVRVSVPLCRARMYAHAVVVSLAWARTRRCSLSVRRPCSRYVHCCSVRIVCGSETDCHRADDCFYVSAGCARSPESMRRRRHVCAVLESYTSGCALMDEICTCQPEYDAVLFAGLWELHHLADFHLYPRFTDLALAQSPHVVL